MYQFIYVVYQLQFSYQCLLFLFLPDKKVNKLHPFFSRGTPQQPKRRYAVNFDERILVSR